MKKNYKGFTLLELLVIVLIIGILSALALPKYQNAIDKSKFAHYEMMVKDISGSIMRVNLMKNTNWGYTFEELDINIPNIKSTISITASTGEVAIFDWGYCYIIKPKSGTTDGDIFCGGKDSTGYLQTIQLANENLTFSPYCVANKNSARSVKLCESVGTDATDFGGGCVIGINGKWFCNTKIKSII